MAFRRAFSRTSDPRSKPSSSTSPAAISANNMNSIRVMLYKAFARFFCNRSAVALTFLVPIGMIYIFGQVFGLNRKQSGPSGIPLAVVNERDHPAARRLVQTLQAEKAFRVVTDFNGPDKAKRPLRED